MLDSDKNYQLILKVVGKTLVRNRIASKYLSNEILTTYKGKNSALPEKKTSRVTTTNTRGRLTVRTSLM